MNLIESIWLFSSNLLTSPLVSDESLSTCGFEYIFLNHSPKYSLFHKTASWLMRPLVFQQWVFASHVGDIELLEHLLNISVHGPHQEVYVSSCNLYLQDTGWHVLCIVLSLLLFRRMIYFQEFKWLSYLNDFSNMVWLCCNIIALLVSKILMEIL